MCGPFRPISSETPQRARSGHNPATWPTKCKRRRSPGRCAKGKATPTRCVMRQGQGVCFRRLCVGSIFASRRVARQLPVRLSSLDFAALSENLENEKCARGRETGEGGRPRNRLPQRVGHGTGTGRGTDRKTEKTKRIRLNIEDSTGSGRLKHILWRTSWGSYRARNQKSKTAVRWGRPLPSVLRSRIFDSGNGSAPAGPPFSAFRTAVGAVGSLLAIHPWMAEEIMKPLLHFSSFRVGHSSGLAVLGPSDTLLDRCATPRPRRSMTPSAWWSTLRN